MRKRKSIGTDPIEGVDESRKDKVLWTEKMDEYLIDALLHQQTIGNRVDGTWSSVALSNVSKELSEKLEMDINKDRVKNRLKTIKQKFSSCFDLFKNLSGFAWCPVTSMWMVERETWEPLLKVCVFFLVRLIGCLYLMIFFLFWLIVYFLNRQILRHQSI